jgi:hypothetical protein
VNYDIIGDVHGRHDRLVALLRTLGYQETMRAWRHPDRTAVFVGDFIDRGPQQVATVKLVRAMVDTGAARAIMGNHEFNAIAWATRDPAHPGKRLRRHDRPGNRRQHRAFLAEVENTPLHAEIIAWFKTLPLWLDLGAIRVVHACWSDVSIDRLQPHLGYGATLTDELIVGANRKGHWAFDAVETLCKGPEVDLPAGKSFTDRDGKKRTKARVRWWEQAPATREARAASPVFFGHYSLDARPAPMSATLACVDYSAGEGGNLVAYRWEGERELRKTHYLWV